MKYLLTFLKGFFVILGYILFVYLIFGLFGCYTERKAKNQFAKAVVAYPKISAEYCANEFPVKDSLITDTLRTSDTILIQGGIKEDTIIMRVNDTVRITIIRELPGKVITNTVHIRDTIIRENTAALKSCEIDKSRLIALTEQQAAQIKKYKGQSTTRGYIMWGLVALIVAVVGLNIYLRSKKIIN